MVGLKADVIVQTFINDCQVGEDDFTLVQGDDQLRFGFDILSAILYCFGTMLTS